MKIDRRGIVDDGSPNLEVQGSITVGGFVTQGYEVVTGAVLAGSGNVTISEPGFYTVAAEGLSTTNGYFTGTVPNPANYPGATFGIVDTDGGHPYQLTGSAWSSTAQVALFVMPPGTSASNSRHHGTQLDISRGGSMMAMSDGYYWCIMAGSGSYTLTGEPVF